MPQFFTPVPLPSPFPCLDYHTTTISLGSCFAQHIAERLSDHKLPVCLNPFGILYNPVSLSRATAYLAGQRDLAEEELFLHHSLWRHDDFHSNFAQPSRATAWDYMSSSLEEGRSFFQRADVLLLTLGSAFVYRRQESDLVVANCHQLPARHFQKSMLTVQECSAALMDTVAICRQIRPEMKIIFTVSPVRHFRDGVLANQRSKSTLLLALHRVCQSTGTYYFPSYEIMMDELRDYRFYARDRLHPSEEAVDYIWEQFSSVAFEPDTKRMMGEVSALVQASRHRPRHPDSSAHAAFVRQQLQKMDLLEQEYPFIDLSAERQQLQAY